jgi:hypothetical protein
VGLRAGADYPSKVFTALQVGLGWLLPGPKSQSDVRQAMKAISERRAEWKWDEAQAAPEMSRKRSK